MGVRGEHGVCEPRPVRRKYRIVRLLPGPHRGELRRADRLFLNANFQGQGGKKRKVSREDGRWMMGKRTCRNFCFSGWERRKWSTSTSLVFTNSADVFFCVCFASIIS